MHGKISQCVKIYLSFSVAIGTAVLSTFSHYSKGQRYTNIRLNLYKSPSRRVVLTSFERFYPGFQGYQQMPWMANVDGVGVWSQSGISLVGEDINMSNPLVSQRENILVAVYAM